MTQHRNRKKKVGGCEKNKRRKETKKTTQIETNGNSTIRFTGGKNGKFNKKKMATCWAEQFYRYTGKKQAKTRMEEKIDLGDRPHPQEGVGQRGGKRSKKNA